MAWAGHTAQTLTYLLATAKIINLSDCIFLVALLALFEAVWESNWPINRGILHELVGPLTWKQAPYLTNWGSQVLWAVLKARRLHILYLVFLPPFLLWNFYCMVNFVRFIDIVDDDRRLKALGADSNTRNPAARIPPEVQLHIFRHVMMFMRLRAEEQPCNTSNVRTRPAALNPGLPATCSVCRAWHDAATEVLYVHVRFTNARCTQRFARTLSERPALARFVRSIVFPDAAPQEPHVVERIVRCCVSATQVSFFRTETSIYDVPGLTFVAQQVRTLVVNAGHHGAGPYRPPEFNMSTVPAMFPNLESLTLSRQNILFAYEDLRPETVRVLRSLRALHLDRCTFKFIALARLLSAMPRAQTVELRNMSPRGQLCSAESLLVAQRLSLRALLLASTVRSAQTGSLVCLCDIHALPALRTLALNARELPHLRALPPALEELVVSFSPYSAWQTRPTCRQSALSAVRVIRALAPSAPALRAVRLSDEVDLADVPDWKIAAFLLREMLRGISVEVNLHLHWEDLSWVRMRLSVERHLFAALFTHF